MPRRILAYLLLPVLLGALGWFGYSRISFNVDVLDVLPDTVSTVEALRLYQKHFSSKQDLVVVLEGENPDDLLLATEALALRLQADGVSREVDWQPAWQDNPPALADMVAYLWVNSEPEQVEALAARLAPDAVDHVLEETLERLAEPVFGDPGTAFQDQYDPFSLLHHPAISKLIEEEGNGRGVADFASDDGLVRLMFAQSPAGIANYREAGEWLQEVDASIARWREETPESAGVEVGLTGEAVFIEEISRTMEGDMTNSVAVVAVIVVLLFWLIQRRFKPLVLLIMALFVIFSLTLSVGGMLFGDLNVMSIGFAAILVGLAADYGVLAAQHQKAFGGDRRSLMAMLRPSILWAAVTTAAVFAALNFSSFPGIAELGSLVAIGILIGAVVMLFGYIPLLAGFSKPEAPEEGTSSVVNGAYEWIAARGRLLALALLALSLVVVGWRGMPEVDYHLSSVSGDDIEAMRVLQVIQKKVGGLEDENLPVIIDGKGVREVRDMLVPTVENLERLQAAGTIVNFTLPSAFWPDPDAQKANVEVLAEVAEDFPVLASRADEAGFTEEALELARMAMERWTAMAAQGVEAHRPLYPEERGARKMLEPFIVIEEGAFVMAGMVRIEDFEAAQEAGFEVLEEIHGAGVRVAAWQTLRTSIRPLLERDVMVVFLPTAGLLLVFLGLVFRDFRDVLLALATMAMTAGFLFGFMVFTGTSWTFQSLSAVPVLLGTGIDFLIHAILALRRCRGQFLPYWQGTGKALLFCGMTTSVAFGSLAFAVDPGLASLGKVCSAGIFLTMLWSVFLLPAWWRALHRHNSQPQNVSASR